MKPSGYRTTPLQSERIIDLTVDEPEQPHSSTPSKAKNCPMKSPAKKSKSSLKEQLKAIPAIKPKTAAKNPTIPEKASADDDSSVVIIDKSCSSAGKKPLAEESEVTVVDRPSNTRVGTSSSLKLADGDIAIVCSTLTAGSTMPHQREACALHPFVPMSTDQVISIIKSGAFGENPNIQHCAKCFCYVCEVTASDCIWWASHCHATCKSSVWKEVKTVKQSDSGVVVRTTEEALRLLENCGPPKENQCVIQ
eukprot:gene31422-37980_t